MTPVAFALLAAVADARDAHTLAFDALLVAIPFAAVAALIAFGDYLEDRGPSLRGTQALLWGVAVVLLVVSDAARSPSSHELPALGSSALIGCLAVFALKGVLATAPYARRLALRPAKP